MTFARPQDLKKHYSGPQPAASDVMALLGAKLACYFDTRVSGVTEGGFWRQHTDLARGLTVRALSDATRPVAIVDGANFKGRQVIRNVGGTAQGMVSAGALSQLAPIGSNVEIFAVARVSPASVGTVVGCANAAASITSGAQIYTVNGTQLRAAIGVEAVATYSLPATPKLITGRRDGGATILTENVAELAIQAGAGVSQATTQLACGSLATGFVAAAEAFIGAWGICVPALTDAERARLLEIVRNDWGF